MKLGNLLGGVFVGAITGPSNDSPVQHIQPKRNAVIVELLGSGKWVVSVEVSDNSKTDELAAQAQVILAKLQESQ